MARERYFDSECIASEALCSSVRHLRFRRVDGERMEHEPGQFVMIHFPDAEGVLLQRSYTLAEASRADGTFLLCVKRVEGGPGSELLHRLAVGDQVVTSGPYGRFVLKQELPRDLVLVATGTGVVPFRAMAGQVEEALARGTRVWLFLGARYADEVLYDVEWRELASRHPHFHYSPTISRPQEDDGWTDSTGYVTPLVEAALESLDPNDAVAYLCGLPTMIDTVRGVLTAAGFPLRAVKTEKFVSPPAPKRK